MDEVVNTRIYGWKYKCLGSMCVVWEWLLICNSSSLTGYIFPPSPPIHHFITKRNHMIPMLLLQHSVKGTSRNLKLITSVVTALTELVLLKLQRWCVLWHLLGLWKVHVIMLYSVIHPRDALDRVLPRAPRDTEWTKRWGRFGGTQKGGKREQRHCWWEERALTKSWNRR